MDGMDVLVLFLIVCLFFSTFVAETMNVGLCCFGTFSPLSLPIFLLKEKERKETPISVAHFHLCFFGGKKIS